MTDLERIDEITREIHELGRRATRRKSYVEGTTYRVAANIIRDEFDLPRLGYDGPRPDKFAP